MDRYVECQLCAGLWGLKGGPPGAHSVLGLRGADRHIDQQQCKAAEIPGPRGLAGAQSKQRWEGDSSGSAGMKLRAHEGRSMSEAGSRSSLLGR